MKTMIFLLLQAVQPQQPSAQPLQEGPIDPLVLVAIIIAVIALVLAIAFDVFTAKDFKKLRAESRAKIEALEKSNASMAAELEKLTATVEFMNGEINAHSHMMRTVVFPRHADDVRKVPPAPKKADETVVLFTSRPDAHGVFPSTTTQAVPGNSIYRIESRDGRNGIFAVINDPQVHSLALMVPTANITPACEGHDIQVTGKATTIVNDAPGRVEKRDDGKWHIVKKAQVHYQ